MSTWTGFYVKWNYTPHLMDALTELSGLVSSSLQMEWPQLPAEYMLMGEDADPDLLILCSPDNTWIKVEMNSFKKLHNWGVVLSQKLNTTFVQVTWQTTANAYYFLMYEKGEFRREIGVCYDYPERLMDRGKKFPREEPIVISAEGDEDYDRLFGLDQLGGYCYEAGLELFEDRSNGTCHIMQPPPKPWWKIW